MMHESKGQRIGIYTDSLIVSTVTVDRADSSVFNEFVILGHPPAVEIVE